MSDNVLATNVDAIRHSDLNRLRVKWRTRWGTPPKLRSAELMRLMLAWRLQAEALGGLERD
ncbi:DUF2924 domain-containing protein [Acuticoccus sp. MNP-M23]|uniref:DUF2924 domain-containing protein n=1 Tax=Acuticoccus sp. MNP-M23 TaxID=3072793 RepID=UPI0028167A22|nr:DUF2924 domain-containing protein [Acuticoccus sp. MNP-M23]WMS43449.1 DUF2924 domain-containing protein [Acuticoccus sp. MNP-M23]WMS44511.1 DUF2924 domain-containing protein [Acuticoccus sp. MNP-M23]